MGLYLAARNAGIEKQRGRIELLERNSAQFAIVGGGPAGARVAELLAAAGCRAVLFEERTAWEKPCGGGITRKALDEYPFLAEGAFERNWIEGCELVSPSGRRVYLPLERTITIFSRAVLNGFLRERARTAGAKIIEGRVTRISGSAGTWRLETTAGVSTSDYVTLAAGARNPFRPQFARTWTATDLITAIGYYVPGTSSKAVVRFLPSFEGYFWSFPRSDHFSAGICGKAPTAQMRVLLDEVIRKEKLDSSAGKFYAHVLPNLSAEALTKDSFAGDGWAMVGDAAGFVDPLTGEGLHYALRSADLLAQALLEQRAERYPASVRDDFLPELIRASRYSHRFYRGQYYGGDLTERMLQMAAYSSEMREILRDLFAGSQGYAGLRERVKGSLPKVFFQTGCNWLLGREASAG